MPTRDVIRVSLSTNGSRAVAAALAAGTTLSRSGASFRAATFANQDDDDASPAARTATTSSKSISIADVKNRGTSSEAKHVGEPQVQGEGRGLVHQEGEVLDKSTPATDEPEEASSPCRKYLNSTQGFLEAKYGQQSKIKKDNSAGSGMERNSLKIKSCDTYYGKSQSDVREDKSNIGNALGGPDTKTIKEAKMISNKSSAGESAEASSGGQLSEEAHVLLRDESLPANNRVPPKIAAAAAAPREKTGDHTVSGSSEPSRGSVEGTNVECLPHLFEERVPRLQQPSQLKITAASPKFDATSDKTCDSTTEESSEPTNAAAAEIDAVVAEIVDNTISAESVPHLQQQLQNKSTAPTTNAPVSVQNQKNASTTSAQVSHQYPMAFPWPHIQPTWYFPCPPTSGGMYSPQLLASFGFGVSMSPSLPQAQPQPMSMQDQCKKVQSPSLRTEKKSPSPKTEQKEKADKPGSSKWFDHVTKSQAESKFLPQEEYLVEKAKMVARQATLKSPPEHPPKEDPEEVPFHKLHNPLATKVCNPSVAKDVPVSPTISPQKEDLERVPGHKLSHPSAAKDTPVTSPKEDEEEIPRHRLSPPSAATDIPVRPPKEDLEEIPRQRLSNPSAAKDTPVTSSEEDQEEIPRHRPSNPSAATDIPVSPPKEDPSKVPFYMLANPSAAKNISASPPISPRKEDPSKVPTHMLANHSAAKDISASPPISTRKVDPIKVPWCGQANPFAAEDKPVSSPKDDQEKMPWYKLRKTSTATDIPARLSEEDSSKVPWHKLLPSALDDPSSSSKKRKLDSTAIMNEL